MKFVCIAATAAFLISATQATAACDTCDKTYVPNNNVDGKENFVYGDVNYLRGNQNAVIGHLNGVKGNQNKLYGTENRVKGNENRLVGDCNGL